MDLMHNQVIRICTDEYDGLYRVIVDFPRFGKTVLAKLSGSGRKPRGGRPRKEVTRRPRKKPPVPRVGSLVWAERDQLEQASLGGNLEVVEIELEALYYDEDPLPARRQKLYGMRCEAMKPFLSLETLAETLLVHRSLGPLVQQVVLRHSVSAVAVYGWFSILCRRGFSERSLRRRHDLCGAKGVLRPCDRAGRKKAGRKTDGERVAVKTDSPFPIGQPGMSTAWRTRILAADRCIPEPKPPMPARYKKILNSHFVKRYRDEERVLVPSELKQGDYPNRRQVARVLTTEFDKLQRLRAATTKGNFKLNHRGLRGRAWQGASGPGHTYAIDSTVADIYLRSTVDRTWISGRPILYIIVDVWSTAIVGFYLCLTAPSWANAKVALFSGLAGPEMLGDLWGFQASASLFPSPGMCAILLCDRGEYLSRAASETFAIFLPIGSIAPPYRGDLKGSVEVMHRIVKDSQYWWIPGAIDARRREYELRPGNVEEATLDLRQYAAYLHVVFDEYNLSANRENRLDAHMKAAGVFPSPAGLWKYGHEIGIGVRRYFSESSMVADLLPRHEASVTKRGVRFAGRDYHSDAIDEQQWSALARNFGAWRTPAYHFPGTVSRIWVPNTGGSGLLKLDLSDHSTASPECTFEDVLDSNVFHLCQSADREHARTTTAISAMQRAEQIKEDANRLTAEALKCAQGAPKPGIKAVRAIETALGAPASAPPPTPAPAVQGNSAEEDAAYEDMMAKVLAAQEEQ